MIDGEVSASLAVSDKIPDGRYAVNFLVQHGYFKISGTVSDREKRDTNITYILIPKNKQGSYLDVAPVAKDGSFRLKSTLFADSAFFIFSPTHKIRNNFNYLTVHIETPLDSAFVPVLQETQFISVGNPNILVSSQKDTSGYVFDTRELTDVTILPNVTVTGKFKSKVQQYDEEYSSGLFKSNDAIIFDGLGSDDISRSATVLLFLQGRVAGLTIERNNEGQEVAKWRNEVAEIYVDEFKLEPTDHTFISPSEIAMIKVYRPPAHLTGFSGGAGAIAIYTKKGIYADTNRKSLHNFIVKGYTNVESRWQ